MNWVPALEVCPLALEDDIGALELADEPRGDGGLLGDDGGRAGHLIEGNVIYSAARL